MGDGHLTAFWISFPEDASFPHGLGVTAWSQEGAFRLLEEQGYDFHLRAAEVAVRAVDWPDAFGTTQAEALRWSSARWNTRV